MPTAHLILATIGTDGDVLPFVGLGSVLAARGHRVTLLANETFGPLARSQGMDFQTLVTADETLQFLQHPDVWHPRKSAGFIARWGLGFLERNYRQISDLAAADDTLLVVSVGVLGARLAQEKLGRPMVSIVLQPWLVPSVESPPVMPFGSLPRWAPKALWRLYWRGVELATHWLIGRGVNRLRAALGLPRERHIFVWWYSPQRVIGMFPAWYGAPEADWPPQMRLAGFAHFDGRADAALSADAEQFLSSGRPTVAITFGTGMMHAKALFAAAIAACGRLGLQAALMTRHLDQLPHELPPHARSFAFEPFGKLFPRCAAVVHHGGIGTTARALAAGTPQLIVPFAYDQFDNADRVVRLGCGRALKPGRATARRFAAALGQLVSEKVRESCRIVAGKASADDGLALAVRLIEEQLPACAIDERAAPPG